MGQPSIRTVRTDDFSMDYAEFGSGPRAFVILPGLSVKSVLLSAAGIAAAYADFADCRTVYVFDRVREMRSGYTVSDMAEDTAAAMKLLGISGADVFGSSQGGMMAMLLAARHPELVRRLAVSSTAARMNDTARSVFPRWIKLAENSDAVSLNRDMFRHIYSDEYREQFRDVFRSMEPDATPEELRRTAIGARACYDFDCLDEIGKILCPVLVTGSKADRVFTDSTSREIAEHIPDARLFLYDGFSHAVYDEAPDHRARLLQFFTE